MISLFAEFVANDRPLIVSYKGEILFPVLVDYPEEKFGGFLAVTDYRTPDIANEINANGWMLWPPIRYSYDTINKDYPGRIGENGICLGYPAPPPWASSLKLCDAPADQVARFKELGNTNWLGLDGQGRDVVARVIYGFRISVLFGLILTIVSSALGVLAGAVQGYFGGKADLIFQRLLEIWNSMTGSAARRVPVSSSRFRGGVGKSNRFCRRSSPAPRPRARRAPTRQSSG